jgi:ABC-2 type transport system permease protein
MTAIMRDIPISKPTVTRAVLSMMARDLRVIRRATVMHAIRVVLQPLLFVFVFAYVLPKVGPAGKTGFAAASGTTFATVMIPGLIGSAMVMQSMASVVFPIVMDLSGPGSIEDRVLAPVPVRFICLQKIIEAMVEGLLAGLLVIPVVLFVHAPGQAPSVHVADWPLLVVVMLAGVLLASSLGMFLGTVIDARQVQVLFTLIMFPAMMLGCVYFRWTSLAHIRWLQIAVLVNPMVYLNEGLRAALTPQLSHMPVWAFLIALLGGSALFCTLALRSFVRRVTR